MTPRGDLTCYADKMSLRLHLAVAAAALAVGGTPLAALEELKVVERQLRAPATARWREGQVIVVFRDGADDRDIERALRDGGAREAHRARAASHRLLVQLDPGLSVRDAVQRFSRMPEVLYAEPNRIVRATQAATFRPNDTFYRYQWNLTQMNAERTWAIQKGTPSVAVAVLDTGVAYEDYRDPVTGQAFRKAPDWGDTVFLAGFDFVNNDSHPNDDAYHGTHVASTIAEGTNNGLGMAGLAFGCAILPVKILDENGVGDDFALAEGIDFATDFRDGDRNPVKVINLSLGGPEPDPVEDALTIMTVTTAVDRALAAGILVVAAAGNAGTGGLDFPASLPSVIAVGALDARKRVAFYSNIGSQLDFVAPGGNCEADDDGDGKPDCVWQQMPDPDSLEIGRHDQFCYCGLYGTSMAVPHVSAAAALLFSQGFTDAAAVRKALEQTAERMGGAPPDGRNDSYGFGLVRPANALPGMGPNLGPRN
jgi:serine protease